MIIQKQMVPKQRIKKSKTALLKNIDYFCQINGVAEKSSISYESHTQIMAISVWSLSPFQENISRSKTEQSC